MKKALRVHAELERQGSHIKGPSKLGATLRTITVRRVFYLARYAGP